MLEQHLRRLVEDLELDEIPIKNPAGVYPLKLTANLEISIRENDPGVSFYTSVGSLPTTKREELFIHLMKGNFLGQGTGGGSLAIDENEKSLTLSLVLPYDMNFKTFKEALEDFVNFVDYWKEELKRHNDPT